MATSGTMQGNSVTITGGGFGGNYIFTNWQLASQNTGGNYSTINWQTYFHFNADDAQLDGGRTDASVGNIWFNGGRVYNYSGNFSTRNLGLASGTFNIGHNNDGTQSLGISGSISVYQSGGSSGSAGWPLPTIPRFANITGFSVTSLTDTSFNINVSTDATCSSMNYSLDGGATWTGVGGAFTSQTISITGLPSETSYTVVVQVQRQDSGLWTTSGGWGATTNRQQNFIGLI